MSAWAVLSHSKASVGGLGSLWSRRGSLWAFRDCSGSFWDLVMWMVLHCSKWLCYGSQDMLRGYVGCLASLGLLFGAMLAAVCSSWGLWWWSLAALGLFWKFCCSAGLCQRSWAVLDWKLVKARASKGLQRRSRATLVAYVDGRGPLLAFTLAALGRSCRLFWQSWVVVGSSVGGLGRPWFLCSCVGGLGPTSGPKPSGKAIWQRARDTGLHTARLFAHGQLQWTLKPDDRKWHNTGHLSQLAFRPKVWSPFSCFGADPRPFVEAGGAAKWMSWCKYVTHMLWHWPPQLGSWGLARKPVCLVHRHPLEPQLGAQCQNQIENTWHFVMLKMFGKSSACRITKKTHLNNTKYKLNWSYEYVVSLIFLICVYPLNPCKTTQKPLQHTPKHPPKYPQAPHKTPLQTQKKHIDKNEGSLF